VIAVYAKNGFSKTTTSANFSAGFSRLGNRVLPSRCFASTVMLSPVAIGEGRESRHPARLDGASDGRRRW
jgi:hypothetical protein